MEGRRRRGKIKQKNDEKAGYGGIRIDVLEKEIEERETRRKEKEGRIYLGGKSPRKIITKRRRKGTAERSKKRFIN
jgi:hypothetical protein